MSPLPLSTTVLIAHGAGSVAACDAAVDASSFVPLVRASTTASTAPSMAPPLAEPPPRVHRDGERRRGKAGQPTGFSVVDAERSSVEQHRDERVVRRREAVE